MFKEFDATQCRELILDTLYFAGVSVGKKISHNRTILHFHCD
jgi:hypothetical protein